MLSINIGPGIEVDLHIGVNGALTLQEVRDLRERKKTSD